MEHSLRSKQDFLTELCRFLESWKWLALIRPTHVFVDGVLDSYSDVIDAFSSLPVEAHLALLNGRVDVSSLPKFVGDFVEATAKFQHCLISKIEEGESPGTPRKKTSAKKQHETSRLSSLVLSVCTTRSLKCIVDIGSGLGYIDRELCRVVDDCQIVALESEEERCKSADISNKMLGLGERIQQLPMKLQGSNVRNVCELLRERLPGDACLLALHACGDLTPTALWLFTEMPSLKYAVILSCCYHKMSTSGKTFLNFPLSNFLKGMFASGSADMALIDVSLLRLAAESTKETWASRGVERLTLHARSVAYRALIELYCRKKAVTFTKIKRKAVKPSSRTSWQAYITAWISNTEATRITDGHTVEKDVLKVDLEDFIDDDDVENLVRKVMAFNTLKTCIQHIVELLVLEDRLMTLMEAGFPQCELVRVSNPAISPRSIAIVVSR